MTKNSHVWSSINGKRGQWPPFFRRTTQATLAFLNKHEKVAIITYLKIDQGVTDSLIKYIKDTAKTKYENSFNERKNEIVLWLLSG